MLKIRLRRMGKRHRPFYRVVVSDSRSVPTAPAVEEVGHYDPMAKPPSVKIDVQRIEHWVGQGALMSPTVKKLVKDIRTGRVAKAEQEAAAAKAKPPAAPKKEAEAPVEQVAEEKAEAAPAEEQPTEEKAEAAPAKEQAEEAKAEAAPAEEQAEEAKEDEAPKEAKAEAEAAPAEAGEEK